MRSAYLSPRLRAHPQRPPWVWTAALSGLCLAVLAVAGWVLWPDHDGESPLTSDALLYPPYSLKLRLPPISGFDQAQSRGDLPQAQATNAAALGSALSAQSATFSPAANAPAGPAVTAAYGAPPLQGLAAVSPVSEPPPVRATDSAAWAPLPGGAPSEQELGIRAMVGSRADAQAGSRLEDHQAGRVLTAVVTIKSPLDAVLAHYRSELAAMGNGINESRPTARQATLHATQGQTGVTLSIYMAEEDGVVTVSTTQLARNLRGG